MTPAGGADHVSPQPSSMCVSSSGDNASFESRTGILLSLIPIKAAVAYLKHVVTQDGGKFCY